MNPSTVHDIGRLLLRCDDRPGLVSAVSTFLTEAGANIVSLDQHSTQRSGGMFMQRAVFHLPGLADSRDALVRGFAEQIATRFGMEYTLTEASTPKRVAIMASKDDHCLLDLLWRNRRGELDVIVVAVISNHPDLADQARPFGVPFVHVPFDARDRDAAYGEDIVAACGRDRSVVSDDIEPVFIWRGAHVTRRSILAGLGAVGLFVAVDLGAALVGIHMTLGIAILVIVLVRAANRFTHRPPRLPATVGGLEHELVIGSELSMYALLLAQPLVGWAIESSAGRPVEVFGRLRLPDIVPFDADTYFVLRQAHSVLAYLLVLVIVAHVSAVLLHTLTLRDGMLSRMTFSQR